MPRANRIFFLSIPPNVFLDAAGNAADFASSRCAAVGTCRPRHGGGRWPLRWLLGAGCSTQCPTARTSHCGEPPPGHPLLWCLAVAAYGTIQSPPGPNSAGGARVTWRSPPPQ